MGDNGRGRGRVFRNNSKGHMYKTNGDGNRGGRWGWLGWGDWWEVNADKSN